MKRKANLGSTRASQLGETSLEQGDDGGVVAALGGDEGSAALSRGEARIPTRCQQYSHSLNEPSKF